MNDFHSQFHPKERTGKECKKVKCSRYGNYISWRLGSSSLKFCMSCKHAYVSQYNRLEDEK